MRLYHEVFGHELPPQPREPVLSDYYTPSNEQHDREVLPYLIYPLWYQPALTPPPP